MNGHGSVWDENNNTEKLKVLVTDGFSASQIGEKLNVSRNSVISKCTREGLKLHGALGRKYIETGEPIPRKASKRFNLLPAKMPKLAAADSPRVSPPPLPLPPAPPEPDISRCSFYELGQHQCHFVVGDPTEMRYCGDVCDPKMPYCKKHARMVYVPVNKRPLNYTGWLQ